MINHNSNRCIILNTGFNQEKLNKEDHSSMNKAIVSHSKLASRDKCQLRLWLNSQLSNSNSNLAKPNNNGNNTNNLNRMSHSLNSKAAPLLSSKAAHLDKVNKAAHLVRVPQVPGCQSKRHSAQWNSHNINRLHSNFNKLHSNSTNSAPLLRLKMKWEGFINFNNHNRANTNSQLWTPDS